MAAFLVQHLSCLGLLQHLEMLTEESGATAMKVFPQKTGVRAETFLVGWYTTFINSCRWRRAVDITHQHSSSVWHSPLSTCALATDRDLVATTISPWWLKKRIVCHALSHDRSALDGRACRGVRVVASHSRMAWSVWTATLRFRSTSVSLWTGEEHL